MNDDLSDDELLFMCRWASDVEAITPTEYVDRLVNLTAYACNMTLAFAVAEGTFMWERCPHSFACCASVSFSLACGFTDEFFTTLDTLLARWQELVRNSNCCVLLKIGPGTYVEFAFRQLTEAAPMTHALGYASSVDARTFKRPPSDVPQPVCVHATFGRFGYGANETAPFMPQVMREFVQQFVHPILDTYIDTHVDLIVDDSSTRHFIKK